VKTCTKCGIEKELSEFGKDKRNKSGLTGMCVKCKGAGVSRWLRLHIEKEREYRQKQRDIANPGYVKKVKIRTGISPENISAYRETLLIRREAREFKKFLTEIETEIENVQKANQHG
jgi:hypothetical protein